MPCPTAWLMKQKLGLTNVSTEDTKSKFKNLKEHYCNPHRELRSCLKAYCKKWGKCSNANVLYDLMVHINKLTKVENNIVDFF